MKSILSGLLISSLLISLTGCVTATIQSNVKADAKPEFKRILIVSRLPKTNPTYLASLQTAFPAGYQVCTVSNSPISFESAEEAIEKQRQTCQSEVVLTIDFNRSYTSGSGRYISSNNELLLEMKSLTTGIPFWKALVTTSLSNNEIVPRELVTKLINDGIIQGSAPLGRSYQSTY
ncbi:hypothetical protein [Spirosoma gilvum]